MINYTALRKFYIDHGIKFIKVDYIKYSKIKNRDEIYLKKLEFCKKIAKAKYEQREIIYIDQTTFSIWVHQNRVRQSPSDRIQFIQPDTKCKNITLYGAITESGLFSYKQYNTTNTENFVDFIEVMKQDELKLR